MLFKCCLRCKIHASLSGMLLWYVSQMVILVPYGKSLFEQKVLSVAAVLRHWDVLLSTRRKTTLGIPEVFLYPGCNNFTLSLNSKHIIFEPCIYISVIKAMVGNLLPVMCGTIIRGCGGLTRSWDM